MPQYFDTYKTLVKNEALTNEIYKNINQKEYNSNNVEAQLNEMEYDVLKCGIEINGLSIQGVIDTGANITVFSKHLVDKLNLPINKINRPEITLVNNEKMDVPGTCLVPIKIKDKIYECEAIIMEEAAQELLIGIIC